MPTRFTIALLLLSLTACQADWELPQGYVLECESNADCPHTLTCHAEKNVCIDKLFAVCGNDVVEADEACDDGNELGDDYCSADCKAVIGSCGDGTKQTKSLIGFIGCRIDADY